jgi:hypothetical protein
MTARGASPGHLRGRWTGWLLFAGAFLLASAVAHVVVGLLAVTRTTGMNLASMPVMADYRTVGWSFLGLGVVLAAGAVGVMQGRTWARVVTIVLLAISALNNLALPWGVAVSVVILVLDLAAIYAIAAHGKEASRRITGPTPKTQ